MLAKACMEVHEPSACGLRGTSLGSGPYTCAQLYTVSPGTTDIKGMSPEDADARDRKSVV